MAQELRSLTVQAPGFNGINTEESPLSLDPTFCTEALNCVIDQSGRLGSRKGFTIQTEDNTALGGDPVETIYEFQDSAGNRKLFACGGGKIFSGTDLTDETPELYSITNNRWQIVNFNDNAYFFQAGQEPLVYNNTDGLQPISDVTGWAAPARSDITGNVVLPAFGRLWVADFANDKSTIYWSDLLQGHVWTGGSSGSIDISRVWPDGYDEIVSLVAHNNLLLIFGKRSIVAYQGADSPANMSLADTVTGLGAVSRDAVQYIGTDVLFLSDVGLRSFSRAIQEKALPITDLSLSIKRDIQQFVQEELVGFHSVYSPENSFVLFMSKARNRGFCFDIRGSLPNGAYRVTEWLMPVSCFYRAEDGTLYVGTTDGVGRYTGYSDGGEDYRWVYVSPNLTFGDTTKVKLLKKFQPTVIGGSTEDIIFKWGYDFNNSFSSQVLTLTAQGNIGYWGESEWNIAEFTTGSLAERKNINTTGNGFSVVLGVETIINGAEFSLQDYNVLTLIGKTL